MKGILLFFITILLFFQTRAQENDSIEVVQSPTGRLSRLIDIQDLVNEGSDFWEEGFKGHWAGVELGVNGFARADYSLYGPGRSFLSNDWFRSNMLNINLLQYSKGLQSSRNTIGLVTGLGLGLQSYHLENNTSIELDANGKIQPVNLYFDTNQKSKLAIAYVEIPLLAEFQVPFKNNDHRLYFSLGINAGRRLTSHTKIKYRSADKKEKLKSPGDYAIRDFKFSGTARVGYHWFHLFASYDFTPLFEDQKGPELYPFSLGIKLISF